MSTAIDIGSVTCITMILAVLFKPQVKIRRIFIDTYWPIAMIGAFLLVIFKSISFKEAVLGLTADTAINPIKILVLFLSMTILSIFLDEAGFFHYLANATLKKAESSQFMLFTYLYLTVSVLTIFTSNDIIILTFTPFICYFTKNANISAIPYLVAQFVAANTWSLMLVIGNPTNIYLATSYNISFIEYSKVMLLPTLAAGITAFLVLWLIFKKQLKKEISPSIEKIKISDKPSLIIGLIHLGLCTLLLVLSSYINIEMWPVSLGFAVSLFVCIAVSKLIQKKKLAVLVSCIKRAPWQLVPFVISMFVIVLALDKYAVTDDISGFLGTDNVIYKYGLSSFITANLINNIPMSVLYSSIAENLPLSLVSRGVYGAIIGSNIGAFLTPVGALAGIMWTSLLKKHEIKYTFADFIRYGIVISVPTILASLFVLDIVLK